MRDSLTFKNWELEGVLRGLRVRIELKRGDNKSDPDTFARLNTPQARVKTIQGLGRRLDEETFTDDKGNRFNVYTHLTNSRYFSPFGENFANIRQLTPTGRLTPVSSL